MSKEKPSNPPSLEDVEAHLDALKRTRPVRKNTTATGDAARVAIDFASASGVGCALGWAVDHWLHTGPWGLLVGLLVGTAAGFKLMMRDETRMENKEHKTPPAKD